VDDLYPGVPLRSVLRARCAALLDQQRRMARGMRLMLDNPDSRAIPGNPRSSGGRTGNEYRLAGLPR
jgi:hypothetical protein